MADQACAALIAGHGGWHYYRCGRPMKGSTVASWGSAKGLVVPVCGIHLRAKIIMANADEAAR